MSTTQAERPVRAPDKKTPRKGSQAAQQRRLAMWLLLPSAIAVFGVVVYPVLRTLLISFFEVNSALATETPFVGLQNYASVLTDAGFWASIGRTMYFTVLSTGLELLLGL